MTWKPKKKQTLDASLLERYWEKYGTWVSGALAVVLAVVLVVVLVNRYYESKAQKGQGELDAVSADDPNALQRLQVLAHDYGETRLDAKIQLKLAQVQFLRGDYPGAEKTLGTLRGSQDLPAVDRAQVDLTLAYVAQEKGEFAEARRRYQVVEDGGLYATEAKHMLDVLDRVQKTLEVPVPTSEPKK